MRPRSVDRVFPVGESMATEQVDRRRDVLPPGDPRAWDPFIFLSEDWFSRVGFDWHPHRGFETVTYVIDGQLEHRDNAGGEGVLGPGDLQWVTAGRGVIHTELAAGRRPVHTLQLWLNLPRAQKLVAPRYQDLRAADAPVVREPGVVARIFAGTQRGLSGKAATHRPAGVVDARLDAGARFALELPGEQAAFFYVLAGSLRAGPDGRAVRAGEVAWLAAAPDATAVELAADEETHVIAYSGQPIGEPVFQYGPFVMSSRDEIIEAIHAYRRGEFGPMP